MANEKRVRQKEGRLQRLEEQRAAEKRSQRLRQLRAVGLLIVAIVGIGILVAVLGGDDEEVATESTTDTTGVTPTEGPSTEAPTTTEVVYSEPDIAEEVLAREPPAPKEGAPKDTPKDAVEIETVIEGEGRAVESGDTVTVHYYGVLPSGESFDDSWSRGAPFTTTIPGQVIDGWNEGLIGRKIGERFELTLGSDKAYGSTGNAGIPPDTPLLFVIDVVDAVPPAG